MLWFGFLFPKAIPSRKEKSKAERQSFLSPTDEQCSLSKQANTHARTILLLLNSQI
jgi:hypothetical protein